MLKILTMLTFSTLLYSRGSVKPVRAISNSLKVTNTHTGR